MPIRKDHLIVIEFISDDYLIIYYLIMMIAMIVNNFKLIILENYLIPSNFVVIEIL